MLQGQCSNQYKKQILSLGHMLHVHQRLPPYELNIRAYAREGVRRGGLVGGMARRVGGGRRDFQ